MSDAEESLATFKKLLPQFTPGTRTHEVLVDLIAKGEKKLSAQNTPQLTAQAAADYYHDLTAAQDMLDGKA